MGVEAIVGGVISGGLGLLSSSNASGAAKDAARVQSQGIDKQIAFQQEAFNAQNRLLAPTRQIGFGAQDMLSRMFLGTGSPLAQSAFETGTPSQGAVPDILGPNAGQTVSGAQAVAQPTTGQPTLNAAGEAKFQNLVAAEVGTPESIRANLLNQPQYTTPGQVAPVATVDAGSTAPGTFEPGSEEFDFSGFYESPGYQFRLEEGNKAIENRLAASGRLDSGAGTKDFIRFNQGMASDEFNNFTNQLFNLAGFGQTANQSTANALQNTGNQVGQAFANQGTVQASGIVGAANAQSNALAGLPGAFASGAQIGRNFAAPSNPNVLLSQQAAFDVANNPGIF